MSTPRSATTATLTSEDSTPASLAELIRELERIAPLVLSDTISVRARARDGHALAPRFKHHFTPYASRHSFESDGIYAVSRHVHRPGTLAFLLRVPSQYSSTALHLWLFEASDSSFTQAAEVADGFGDGAWYFTTNGWLVDLDADGVRDIVSRSRAWWEDDETGKEHEADTLLVQLWSGNSFSPRRISTDAILRARFDVANWRK